MKAVTLLEFRKNDEKIIGLSKQGKRMVMTYRGRPVMRLEPILNEERISENDPFHLLDVIADGNKESMKNGEIDRIVYGK